MSIVPQTEQPVKDALTNAERSFVCRRQQRCKRLGLPFHRADELIRYRKQHTAPDKSHTSHESYSPAPQPGGEK